MRAIIIAALLLLSWPAHGQAPPTPYLPPTAPNNNIGDPTRNVLDKVLDAVTRINDLMQAAKERSDALRDGETKLNVVAREADNLRNKELREAETRRVNELSTQKQIFDLEMARVIRAGQDSSTLLLAGAVKEVKSDSSERFSKLEQFANEQRGRASGQGESLSFVWAIIGAIGLIGGLIVGVFGAMSKRAPVPVVADKAKVEIDPKLIDALLQEFRSRSEPAKNG